MAVSVKAFSFESEPKRTTFGEIVIPEVTAFMMTMRLSEGFWETFSLTWVAVWS